MKGKTWLWIAGAAALAFFFLRGRRPAATAGPTPVRNRPDDTPATFWDQLSSLWKNQTVAGTRGSAPSGGGSPFRIGGSTMSLDLSKAVSGLGSLIGSWFQKKTVPAPGATQLGRVSDASISNELAGLTSPYVEDWWGSGGLGLIPQISQENFFDFGGYEMGATYESDVGESQTWVDAPDAFFDWSMPDVFASQEGMV